MYHHAAYIGSKEIMEISKNTTLNVSSFPFIVTIFFTPITNKFKM